METPLSLQITTDMTQNALQLQMVAKTNVGKVREHNEDNFIVTSDVEANWVVPAHPYYNPTNGSMMVVADGMGGTNAGEIASKITIDSICAFFRENIAKERPTSERLVTAIQYAHQQILEYASLNPETEGMGTTVVIAHILNDQLYVAWSGDSRCYLLREGKLLQLTKDHSYVQTLLDEGKLTKTQAFYHPQSNVILQSLGDSERPPAPDIVVETLYQDDVVMLCSDGLNSMIEDHTIESILQSPNKELALCIDKLIKAANDAGGNDNITVVVNRVVKGHTSPSNDNGGNNTLPNPRFQTRKKTSTAMWVALGMTFASVGLAVWYYPELQKKWETKPINTPPPSPAKRTDTVVTPNDIPEVPIPISPENKKTAVRGKEPPTSTSKPSPPPTDTEPDDNSTSNGSPALERTKNNEKEDSNKHKNQKSDDKSNDSRRPTPTEAAIIDEATSPNTDKSQSLPPKKSSNKPNPNNLP
ncbi:Stp1/IreP family PP2C-type Ser/Thr phosphatase [Runella sp. MFBS21]|uniref:Stp1/IreP family PP2C-type Ser/Thr phosphatase n=1 Tax=Runella sp. MFBS21 TaxID=3034018 RepID=UPI0023F83A2E|nr:Stp1/IreP family PP2C-type Ser/Thr phosphatase [Runella sp. MFBS21]MDF7817262.1 Stp1/IreP family PP2C-type Ser/Thr phosphatase [Runella sp. MFBS21]